jgi:hypothetical protein
MVDFWFCSQPQAELGLVLMFASMMPIYWVAGRERAVPSRVRELQAARAKGAKTRHHSAAVRD